MKSNFIHIDVTPDGEDNESNCVFRAIKTATRLSYQTIRRLLRLISEHYDCDEKCLCCYHKLLDGIFGYPVKYCTAGETVGEIAKKHKNDVLIIRIDGHLTCSIDGICVDIWDCTKKTVDCYWIVK